MAAQQIGQRPGRQEVGQIPVQIAGSNATHVTRLAVRMAAPARWRCMQRAWVTPVIRRDVTVTSGSLSDEPRRNNRTRCGRRRNARRSSTVPTAPASERVPENGCGLQRPRTDDVTMPCPLHDDARSRHDDARSPLTDDARSPRATREELGLTWEIVPTHEKCTATLWRTPTASVAQMLVHYAGTPLAHGRRTSSAFRRSRTNVQASVRFHKCQAVTNSRHRAVSRCNNCCCAEPLATASLLVVTN